MLRVPERFSAQHNIEGFDCGIASLNLWLERRVLENHVGAASHTFVVFDNNKVAAYYALASIAPAAAGRFSGNIPDLVPVIVLAPLAVATSHHSWGLGVEFPSKLLLQFGELWGNSEPVETKHFVTLCAEPRVKIKCNW